MHFLPILDRVMGWFQSSYTVTSFTKAYNSDIAQLLHDAKALAKDVY